MAFLQPDKILNWNGLKGYQYYLEQHNVNGIAIPTQKELRLLVLLFITPKQLIVLLEQQQQSNIQEPAETVI